MTQAGEIDRVPRTEAEEMLLLRTRPDGWEYLLWAAVLLRKREELEPKWKEHEARHRQPSETVLGEPEALDRLTRLFGEATAIVDHMMRDLNPETEERAFGKVGENGDPQRITELSEGLVAAYGELLDWSARLRADGYPERYRGIFDIASDFADVPLRQFREFVDHVVHEGDGLPAALREGGTTNLVLKLTLTVDPEVQARFQRELDRMLAERQHEVSLLEEHARAMEEENRAIEERTLALQRTLALMTRETEPPEQGRRMGFFGARHERKASKRSEAELAAWQAERDACAERLALAKTFAGEQSSALMLKRGEGVFAAVSGASLVEDRRGAGQWAGRSSGFSFPIASIGGRSIRYRTGRTRGHYVQGAPVPTAIDTGTLYVTNRRVVFQGLKQTRECLFDKLVGFQHTTDGSTVFSVSNRQKPTNVHYGPELSGWFDFRLDLALAHYRNDLPALVGQLEADLAAVDAGRPAPRALAP